MRRVIKTAAVVTVFSFSEKFLGFLYRIYLSRTLGSEGVGIYQIALSVFAVLLTISSSGTPITVSRLMTKYRAEGQEKKINRIITAGLATTFLISFALFCVLFFGHSAFDFLFADERCMTVLIIVLPGLLFTSIYAVFRGVFWGNKDFLPYSIIELLEEMCMIIVGIILISGATDTFDGAKKAGMAVLVSYLFSFTAATALFFYRGGRIKNPKPELKPLLSSAMPITAMRTANSFINSLIAIILPARLIAFGMTQSEALSEFGSAFGMAMPILFIPTTLLGSFSLVLIPEISEHFYKKDHDSLKSEVEKALILCIFISSMFLPVFAVLGEEIGIIVFDSYQGGVYLSYSAFLILPICITMITTSILNSMGYEIRTLIFYIIGALFMLASIWFLPGVMGTNALIIGFAAVYLTTSSLNLFLIDKKCVKKPKYLKFLTFAVIFSVPTVIFGIFLKNILLPLLGTFFTTAVVGIVLVIFNAAFYLIFNLIDVKVLFSIVKKPRKKIRAAATEKIKN